MMGNSQSKRRSMFEQYVTIFGRSWQVYTFALMLGSGLAIGWMLLRAPHNQRTATMQTLVLMLLAGIVVGRVMHIALHQDFFADRAFLLADLSREGGISWQGVVGGALLVAIPALRWQQINTRQFLDTLAPVLPLLAFAAWRGCAASGCAFGQSVPTLAAYPDWLVWLEKDIFRLIEPRFAVQQIGMWLAIMLLVIALWLTGRGIGQGRQFWIILFLFAISMFLLGFLRGDTVPMIAGLRADQYLDAMIACWALVWIFRLERVQVAIINTE
jgi:hypothetical protein